MNDKEKLKKALEKSAEIWKLIFNIPNINKTELMIKIHNLQDYIISEYVARDENLIKELELRDVNLLKNN